MMQEHSLDSFHHIISRSNRKFSKNRAKLKNRTNYGTKRILNGVTSLNSASTEFKKPSSFNALQQIY